MLLDKACQGSWAPLGRGWFKGPKCQWGITVSRRLCLWQVGGSRSD